MLRLKFKKREEPYPFVEPDLEKWPITKLTKDRAAFLKSVEAHTFDRLSTKGEPKDEIAKAVYWERKRIKEEPWKVDPRDEAKFWSGIKSELLKAELKPVAEQHLLAQEMLRTIIRRYANEIAGNFNIQTYWFARRFLTMGFTRLLNRARSKDLLRVNGMRSRLQERILATGDVEHFRRLCTRGTVVLTPTHFSNLDSILIGLLLDFVGVPAFAYGAGLNLFNAGILAYLMNRLGAYRVDRRKKNNIYIETLKAYSNLSIQRGTHSLFFPGGARSRNGAIEERLKMGLLGTAIEAQRSLYETDKNQKIFIVPMVLGYHFVLEANSLISQYLKQTGKENYWANDEFNSYTKILKFVWQFFASSSEIVVHFGKPMDVMGNFVNENGDSIDERGNLIDVRHYFLSNGALQYDEQRDSEYTRLLAEQIVKRYLVENIVLSSHVVAFVAYQMICRAHPELDVFGILRLPKEKIIFLYATFKQEVARFQTILKEYKKLGKLELSDEVCGDVERMIENGIYNMGVYHLRKPLVFDKNGNITTQSLKLLFYYHNKLKGYQLEVFFKPNTTDGATPRKRPPHKNTSEV